MKQHFMHSSNLVYYVLRRNQESLNAKKEDAELRGILMRWMAEHRDYRIAAKEVNLHIQQHTGSARTIVGESALVLSPTPVKL